MGKAELRDRLARDLHDDLASTLGSISLFAASLRAKLKRAPREVERLTDRISSLASDSVEAIGDIVWSVSPERDTLGQLLLRMKDFAAELCTAHGIRYELAVKPGPVEVWLNPEVRRNLYLVLKEALHNAVRHSGGKALTIEAGMTGSDLVVRITDNGRGFRRSNMLSRGHGLRSMEQRAREIGATLKVESVPGSGTIVELVRKMT